MRNEYLATVNYMNTEKNWESWKTFLYTAANILANAETHLQKDHKISLSDFDVLATLYGAENHTLSMNCLKETVLVTTSGLSRSVTRLCDKDWVVKTPDENDRRQLNVALTETGVKAFKEIAPSQRKFTKEIFFDALSAKDQEALRTALGHLKDHLKN